MMTVRGLAIALLLLGMHTLHAQEAAVRKIVLPSLDSQVAARIISLDRRLNPVHSPELAAGMAAQLARSATPFDVFTPILSDARNTESWQQLPEDYYRMAQETGDTLVTVPGPAAHPGVAVASVQVRRLCHQRLSKLPRASLALYRARVDAEAQALLAQGRASRSPAPLRRLVDELFCSSVGDQALDLLGDLAFERGHFEEARHWWSMLVPLDDSAHDRLVFPDARVDLTRVQAKQVLALMFAGRLDEANAAIPRFVLQHGAARGALAGQTDAYGVILRQTLDRFKKDRISNNDEPWTTFGGDASRNRALSQGLSWQLWEDGPAWRVPLPASAADKTAQAGSANRRASFHPIIVNQQVLVADHQSVVSYHLTTGKELFRFDLKSAGLGDAGAVVDAKVRLPRFTLSADHDRAYVRLGRPGLGPKTTSASYLVCLDLTAPDVVKRRALWHVKSEGTFEGSPLVHEGRIYIAASKVAGRRVVTSIVCFDTQGRHRWAREVCDCPEFEESTTQVRYRQHLLTWAGGQVVYASHAGAIVAVDGQTGQPTWGVRYPSRGPLTAEHVPSPRDLTPCVYADGRVFAAPLDTDRVLCLEAVSGRVQWETDGAEVVHLLGASHGRLFATTRNGLMALDMASGHTDWLQPTEGRLPGLGRGLIAGSWLYWPTIDPKLPYRAVTLRSGTQQKADRTVSVLPEPEVFDPTILHTLPVGNLAFGHGCLAIAGLEDLVVYVPAHRLRDAPPDGRPDARIDALYRKARMHASAGEPAEAERTYEMLREATSGQPNGAAWSRLIDVRVTSRKRKRPAEAPEPATPKSSASTALVELALPLRKAWTVEDGELVYADAEICVCIRSETVICRNAADGTIRWQDRRHHAPRDGFHVPSIRWGNLVILCMPDIVEARSVDDGKLAWSFPAPSRHWRLASVRDGVPSILQVADGFVRAERWDDTLLLLDDHRVFYRLQCQTGAIAWQHAPPGAALKPLNGAAFGPHLLRVEDRLWVQSVSGQPGWLKAALPSVPGGTSFTPVATPSRPWLQPPLLVGKQIVFAEEGGKVSARYKAPPHERLWSYQAPGPTSLNGSLCRLLYRDGVLLALVPRNDGHECVRLDPERGAVLWSIPSAKLPCDIDLASACLGDAFFYYIHAGKLYARALNDGAERWTQTLPGTSQSWHLRYTKHYLTVTPGSGAAQGATIGFIDPWDGQWLQRLPIADAKGPVEVRFTPGRLLVSAGGRVHGFRSLDAEFRIQNSEFRIQRFPFLLLAQGATIPTACMQAACLPCR